MPYSALPDSIKESGCRVMYICRNPFDTFVSQWHFLMKGSVHIGPTCWVLEREYRETHKMLFLKYEEMKEEPSLNLRKLVEFLGYPFSLEDVGKSEPRARTHNEQKHFKILGYYRHRKQTREKEEKEE
ncbi:cytosolic sulfotransferase 14-like [Rhododendron vialii]|uniref:cytosolic sulfotransferase 14-like n=1 Tax=Rhododendron vialii TaxID=182163 RepID=UPI00265D9527|nr:cytosolic sulfotransferase 14-like [Rhododendron vialii]